MFQLFKLFVIRSMYIISLIKDARAAGYIEAVEGGSGPGEPGVYH